MVIALYAVLLIAVGVIISRKVKGADDFFVGGDLFVETANGWVHATEATLHRAFLGDGGFLHFGDQQGNVLALDAEGAGSFYEFVRREGA